jgi:uncharacterized membrane protein YfcA
VGGWAAIIAVAAWCFVVALLGTSVGLILGTIRLPIILLVSSSPAAGAGANVGISTVAAATAATTHVRRRTVNWKLVLWMTPPSIVGALIGGYLSGRLPSNVLLAVIGVALTYFGLRTLVGDRSMSSGQPAGSPQLRMAAGWGLVIGFLGGLVGLILGTLRMPALIHRLGETPHRAVATNLVVGFWLGVAGVIGHIPGGVDWGLMVIGSLASIPGGILGSRMTGRLSERQLLRAIGVALLIVGVVTAVRGLL